MVVIFVFYVIVSLLVVLLQNYRLSDVKLRLERANVSVKGAPKLYTLPSGGYRVRRLINCTPELDHMWGFWAVIRTSYIPEKDEELHTIIKVFTDEDDEFNRLQAEALRDKLNER